MTRRSGIAALCLAVLAAPAAADPPRKLTPERLAAAPALGGLLPSELAWHPDGKRLTYLRPAGAEKAFDLLAFDTLTARETLVLAGGKTLDAGGKPLALRGYTWSPQGDSVLVSFAGDVYLIDARTGGARPLAATPEVEEFAQFSPDGLLVAFVRKNDLHVVEVASGRETRLTRTGSSTVLNGRLDWVYEEELASRSGKAYTWAPDSRQLAYLQLDEGRVPAFPIVDFLPVHNDVQYQRYPKAGDPNSLVRVGVVALGRDGVPGPERLVSFTPDDTYVVPDLAWSPDARTLAFQQLNREQNELRLRFLSVPDAPVTPLGEPRTVLVERSSDWVNALIPPRFLKDGRRFLWLSERDGFAHIYVCEEDGSCHAVTKGPWSVEARASFAGSTGSLSLDERTGFVYFTATEKHPRERHLYRARLDGTGRARLTREDGTHRTLLSPDARLYADTWSDASTPPRVWVSTPDGTRRLPVEENRNPEALLYELGTQEWVDLKASDGTLLHGSLLKPAAFDPARRYPVVLAVYGGPHAQTVLDAWDAGAPFRHLLASRGFLVWSLDNRGSAGRGHAFEAPVSRDMGKVELEDHLAGVRYLKSLPYVDADRLGLWGWSYGGYLTLYALTRAPGVFRAGVAGAPVTDWKFYDTVYTERYMGTPSSNPRGYETSSPLRHAAELKADLLLLHGSADDNVHLANTVAFVDALVKAGKAPALMVFPGQKHSFTAKESRIARDTAVVRFLEEKLKP